MGREMAQQEQLNPLPAPRHRAPIASLSWNLGKKKKKVEISFPPLLFTNQTNSGNYRSRKIARSTAISVQIVTARISTQNEKHWSCKSHSSCWWCFGGICCAHTTAMHAGWEANLPWFLAWDAAVGGAGFGLKWGIESSHISPLQGGEQLGTVPMGKHWDIQSQGPTWTGGINFIIAHIKKD